MAGALLTECCFSSGHSGAHEPVEEIVMGKITEMQTARVIVAAREWVGLERRRGYTGAVALIENESLGEHGGNKGIDAVSFSVHRHVPARARSDGEK